MRLSVTARQKEIGIMLVSGMSRAKISEKLGIALGTIDVHKANLQQRLGVDNLVELTRKAIELGWIEP